MMQPQLFVVATSHLDTQWRWTFADTIQRYIPNTVTEHRALFQDFPDYVFSFEGSWRLELLEEYHPELLAEVQEWAKQGKWAPCGAVLDTGDVNTVSPESLVRQILYGNRLFRRLLDGKDSLDIFLPDCFGFGWSLPTIASHCGLRGFSTSKLEWGSSYGIPFSIGRWIGPDGGTLLAQIDPGQYSHPIEEDRLDQNKEWLKRTKTVGDQCGRPFDLKWFGLGDAGGAPDRKSVEKLQQSINGDGELDVKSVAADHLAREISDEEMAKLPAHENEFLLIEHGTGTYTANAAMKRMNRHNELLADLSERLSVWAWLHGLDYPREELCKAWTMFLVNQMHDILPGSSIPEAYPLSYNDEAVARNIFEGIIERAAGALLSLHAKGNQKDSESKLHPFTFQRSTKDTAYQINVSNDYAEMISGDLIAKFDQAGNLSSLNQSGKEYLNKPVRLDFLHTAPEHWPAWTIQFAVLNGKQTGSFGDGDVEFAATTDDCGREVLQITRTAKGSKIIERWRFEKTNACEIPMLVCENFLRWETEGQILKTVFPFSFDSPEATYGLGVGKIKRGNNREKLHEVPSAGWASMEDGDQKVTIMTDCKFGWDKPANDTLRLTVVHSPEMIGFNVDLGGANFNDDFSEQAQLDFGWQRYSYALQIHDEIDKTQSEKVWKQFINPELIFETGLNVTEPKFFIQELSENLNLQSVKLAEDSDEIILRVHEINGSAQKDKSRIKLSVSIEKARCLNGQEQEVADQNEVLLKDTNTIEFEIKPFGLMTLALTVNRSDLPKIEKPKFKTVELPYNLRGISPDSNRQDGDIDGMGHSLPSEQLPEVLCFLGIDFKTGTREYHKPNVLVPTGQEIQLPDGDWNSVHMIVCSVCGRDTFLPLELHKGHQFRIPAWRAKLACADNHVVNGVYVDRVDEMIRGFHHRDCRVAWTCSHVHNRNSNADDAYVRCNLYAIRIPFPDDGILKLPVNRKLRIIAATVVNESFQPAPLANDPLPFLVPKDARL